MGFLKKKPFKPDFYFRFETGLKLVLSKHDMERLYDFEEECVDGLLQTKETDSMQRTDQRIKTTLELVIHKVYLCLN